jgi:hypothetical protein
MVADQAERRSGGGERSFPIRHPIRAHNKWLSL